MRRLLVVSVFVVGLVGLVALVSCGGGSASGSGASNVPSNKVEAAGLAAAADDVLGFLPVDSEIVLGIDAVTLRKSQLWATFESQLVGLFASTLESMRQQCGFDPLSSLERVTIGGRIDANERFSGVMVFRGIAGERTLDCIAQANPDAKIRRGKGSVTISRAGNDDVIATMVGAATLVAHFAPGANEASVQTVVAAGTPLRSSPTFMSLFERREPSAALWVMVNGNSPVLAPLVQAGGRPRAVDGTLTVSDRFTVAIRVAYGTAAEADQIVQSVTPLLGTVRALLDRVDVRADTSTVHIQVVATEAQVRTLAGMLGVALP
jgi:hypothetical protein